MTTVSTKIGITNFTKTEIKIKVHCMELKSDHLL